MEKLANKRVVESWLPFLDERHLKTAIVDPVCVDWDWCPNIQVVVLLPIAECQFGLYKSFIGELKVLPRATILSVESVVHCRAHIKFGLQILDMGKPDIDASRLEKLAGEKVVGM